MPIEFKTEEQRNPTTPVVVEEDLTQPIFTEDEEQKLAIQFLEETGLYAKFLLWCGIQEQLKSLKDSLAITNE
jgi:hypothetical protein